MPGVQTDDIPTRGLPYVRFFVSTEGMLGPVALSYLRSILRIAPVRLVCMSGELEGPWTAMHKLLMTPMDEPMIANVVCTHPMIWSRSLTVPMPKTATSPAERASRTVELYTDGVRNVLFAAAPPTSKAQREAAAKYEAIVVPSEALAKLFHDAIGKTPTVIVSPPVLDHAGVKAAITP